jgi:hypothetical protein
MKDISLDKKQQAEFLGRLFIEEKLLDSQQMSCVKAEIEKASYDYNVSDACAWAFYNHVTHALKSTHPRNWMKNQAKFHEFMTAECLSNTKNNTKDTYVNPEDDIQMPEEHLIELPDGKIPENEQDNYNSSSNIFTL